MKTILYFVMSILIFIPQSRADIFYFETGSYYKERDIRWPGKLLSLDRDKGLLKIRYLNRGVATEIQVHITRIYSITFDTLERRDKDFPPTRRPLIEPLPSQLSPRDQVVELQNSGFLGDDIPEEVRVRPDREAQRLSLRGALVGHDGQVATLSAWNSQKAFSDFDLSALTLRSWIRGR